MCAWTLSELHGYSVRGDKKCHYLDRISGPWSFCMEQPKVLVESVLADPLSRIYSRAMIRLGTSPGYRQGG